MHVNLVGYVAASDHKAADLYAWLGNGGARDYSSFEGNTVYLYNVGTGQATPVGIVTFWKPSGARRLLLQPDALRRLERRLPGLHHPRHLPPRRRGRRRQPGLHDRERRLREPVPGLAARLLLHAHRAGQPDGHLPAAAHAALHPRLEPREHRRLSHDRHAVRPRLAHDPDRPVGPARRLGCPIASPATRRTPTRTAATRTPPTGTATSATCRSSTTCCCPTSSRAARSSDDAAGIRESGNGIPDLIDEARNEVDFWLRLRDGSGYSHGLTNPNGSNQLFQAGPTAMAAWANAANAAMLAEAYRIAGQTALMNTYRDAAIAAYNHASGLADQQLDATQDVGYTTVRGRDLKMTAAAYLFNVTGSTAYEDVVNAESVCRTGLAELENDTRNQTWATAAYLFTPRTVRYPTLQGNMRACVIDEARDKEAEPHRDAAVAPRDGRPPGLLPHEPERAAHDDRARGGHEPGGPRALPEGAPARGRLGARPQSDQHDRDGHGDDAALRQAQHPVHVHVGPRGRRRRHPPRPHALPEPRRLVLRHDDGLPVAALPEHLPRGLPEHLADRRRATSTRPGCGRTPSSRRSRPCGARRRSTATSTRWAAAATPPTFALTVGKAGTGSGTVTSSPAGINCGSDCGESYAERDERHADRCRGRRLHLRRLERRLLGHRDLQRDHDRGAIGHRHLQHDRRARAGPSATTATRGRSRRAARRGSRPRTSTPAARASPTTTATPRTAADSTARPRASTSRPRRTRAAATTSAGSTRASGSSTP